MSHKKFMTEAIRLSRLHMRRGAGGPFGAVVVKNGRIIGRGWNRVTSTHDPTAHAEVSAIRDACMKLKSFELTGAVIYTSCEPCPMCLAAIYWARIDKIYFANTRADAASIEFDDEFLYREIGQPLNRRKVPIRQVARAEALKVFSEWREKADKIRY